MADPVQNVADAPRKAAKGLGGVFKGKPTWVWIAAATVAIGVAYLAFSRRNTEDPQDTADNADSVSTQDDLYDYGQVPSYVTAGSEGAYGGYDQPADYGPSVQDNAGNPEPSPITVNVTYPAPTGGGKPATTGAVTHAPVGGGARKWEGHNLAWWQNPANRKVHKRVKVKGKRQPQWRWRWPGGGGFVHTRAFRGRS